jgi:hypothetical protein
LIVLGLDVSTAVTGYTLLRKTEGRNELLRAGAIELSRLPDVYSKAERVAAVLGELFTAYSIDKVVIEEPLQRFTRGLSSANTIASLLRFNGIVCYLSQKVIGIPPQLVSVNVARNAFGIKIPRGCTNGKEIVTGWVTARSEFAGYEWPTKVMRGGPRRGQTVTDTTCYDIADSAVMGLYGCL